MCRVWSARRLCSSWARLLYSQGGWYLALQHNCHIGNSIKTLSLWNFLLSFEFTLPAASTPALVILAPLDA